jgi:hypothetical protein
MYTARPAHAGMARKLTVLHFVISTVVGRGTKRWGEFVSP